MYQISFPNIGIHLKYVPDSFQIFGIQVRLYGLIIALGFLIALAIVSKEAKRTGQNPELYLDYLLRNLQLGLLLCTGSRSRRDTSEDY